MKKSSTRSNSLNETEPEASRKGSKRSRAANEDAFWDCSFCTFKNRPELGKCEMCGVAKGSSTRRPRLSQVAQQFAKIESQIEQERKKVQRKELQKTRTNKRSSTSSTSNGLLSNAQTLSITVKGITVFMTEYEVSNCSSSNTANTKSRVASSTHENEGVSDNDTNNDDTFDETKNTVSDSGTKSDQVSTDDEQSSSKKNSKKIAGKKTKATNSNKRKLSTNKSQAGGLSISIKKKPRRTSTQNESSGTSSSDEEHSIASYDSPKVRSQTKLSKKIATYSDESETDNTNTDTIKNTSKKQETADTLTIASNEKDDQSESSDKSANNTKNHKLTPVKNEKTPEKSDHKEHMKSDDAVLTNKENNSSNTEATTEHANVNKSLTPKLDDSDENKPVSNEKPSDLSSQLLLNATEAAS